MKFRGFQIGYIAIVALDLFAMFYYPGLRLISKPLIVASLLIWYVSCVKNKQRPLVLSALIFSLFGDILLLFGGENFFMYGVGAFLIAQISYALYFRLFGNFRSNKEKLKALGILFVAAIFYVILFKHLNSMKIPVLFVYNGFGINDCFCSSAAIVNLHSYWLYIFMMSDMILGLNKFVYIDSNFDLIIMLTYSLAQYLIIKGIIDGQTKA